jgi:hypothetical protein
MIPASSTSLFLIDLVVLFSERCDKNAQKGIFTNKLVAYKNAATQAYHPGWLGNTRL